MMGFKTIYENGRSDTHAQMIATFQNGDKGCHHNKKRKLPRSASVLFIAKLLKNRSWVYLEYVIAT